MNIRISTKGKRPMRSLTPSDKVHAIQRIHDGESKASVARDIGVPESTLRGWCKNEDKLRFMSRQAAAEKLGDPLSVKFDPSSSAIGAPPEKRQRVDSSMVLNFSNKLKFDELNAFKRAPMNGLDFGGNKALTELSNFSTLAPDYGSYNQSSKSKLYGADITRPSDPSIAAVSPLSSLTNLSGLTGLGQSPLAISFTELTSNLNLLAQLNPGLAAMSGINGLASAGNSLRNAKQKTQSQGHSPRIDPTERQTGLTVKNWAKQKPSTPTSGDSSSFGLNLCQHEGKSQMKSPSAPLVPSAQLGAHLTSLASLPEDPLLYWLKSQQAIIGFNTLYTHAPNLGATSPPVRSSTPQQHSIHVSTPPIIPNPLTPSSTPSGSLDDKNTAWFNWCKAFGASLSSITPAAAMAALQASAAPHASQLLSNTGDIPSPIHNDISAKTGFENILYSQLTKDSTSSQSPESSMSADQPKSELAHSDNPGNRPEDLSAKARSPEPNGLQNHPLCPEEDGDHQISDHSSPAVTPTPAMDSDQLHEARNSVADCRDVLDNLLYKINNNPNATTGESEPDASYSNEPTIIDDCSHNNNNNSNKTDEEEWTKCPDTNDITGHNYREAIKHGEKFLQWLETSGNTRVTAVQMMQLRYLISSVKRDVENKSSIPDSTDVSIVLNTIELDDSCEENDSPKVRRRK